MTVGDLQFSFLEKSMLHFQPDWICSFVNRKYDCYLFAKFFAVGGNLYLSLLQQCTVASTTSFALQFCVARVSKSEFFFKEKFADFFVSVPGILRTSREW